MKFRLTTIALILMSFASILVNAQVHSQSVGTSTIGATVITPIGISTTTNMSFGKIAGGATAGTVVLSTAGVRTKTGGVSLVVTGSTQSQAVFNVTGNGSATYSILLPTTVNITSGANTMAVNTFVSNPSGTGTLSAGGSQPLNVGATLNVGINQVAGAYTGSFTVTVDYN